MTATPNALATLAGFPWDEADALRDVLQDIADGLAGCTEGSPEEARLEDISNALDAYEAKRAEAWRT